MTIHEKASVGFDRAADSYHRGRPEYPQEAIDFLGKNLQIGPSSVVVDLGAGTGKLTKLLLPLGPRIVAVEPVEGMREKFQSLFPDIKVLDGSAERVPMHDSSVDAVIAAQAFHWFNGPLALKEIHCILKPGGQLGLIWNSRDESIDWISQLTNIMDPHVGDAPRYKTMNWKKAFDETQLFSKLQLRNFTYVQIGSVETFVDRIGSISFISALPERQRSEVLEKVRHLVKTHPGTKEQQEIKLPYRTDVFWCKKIGAESHG